MQPPDPFLLDRRAVRAAFDRASSTYDAAAVLQTGVRAELLSRLALIRLQPTVVVDLGCGTGLGTRSLKDRYRTATVIGLDRGARHAARNTPPQRLAASPAAGLRRCLPATLQGWRRWT